jgi:diguanylate cyclase (GGDEF)-like protein
VTTQTPVKADFIVVDETVVPSGDRHNTNRPAAIVPRVDRTNPLDSMTLRSQVTGILLFGVPILGILAVLLIPGEAAPGVDRANIVFASFTTLLGYFVFRFGRRWPDWSYDVIATLGFAGISVLNVLNLVDHKGVDLTPLYGVVLMVVGLFLPLLRAILQAVLMSSFALVVYAIIEPDIGSAFGHWIMATTWAVVGGAIVAVLRSRLGHTLGSLTVVAETDGLTGLANRAQFLAEAEDQLGASDVGLFLLDLDRFKEVNDHFGHRAGDIVLRVVAERLSSLAGVQTVARLGGDEFAITMVGSDIARRAEAFASQIIALVEEPIELGEVAVEISTSIGIEVVRKHERVETNVALQRADAAMYKAKTESLGFYMYTPELDADQRRRRTLLTDLEGAIASGAISLCFQPKVGLVKNRTIGVEALARWDHKTLGPIPPNEFVGLAEQSGLIDSLTRCVIERALAQSRKWLDAGLCLPIAVNVSSRNFSETFVKQITELLERFDLEPSLLVLEVTERRFTDDTVQTRSVLSELRALGVEIAIDDFGTGYSSLAHLRVLPVDELKIDQSFVLNMENESEGALITQSAIQLGQNLGLRVVAEGVETAETVACLVALGCDVAQGYFYSKPLPAHELELWLVERGEWAELAGLARRVSPVGPVGQGSFEIDALGGRVPEVRVDC